jgi:hypothetical protein
MLQASKAKSPPTAPVSQRKEGRKGDSEVHWVETQGSNWRGQQVSKFGGASQAAGGSRAKSPLV